MKNIAGFAMLFLGCSAFAFAGIPVPEIDANSSIAAVALLAGGLLVLRARRQQ